MKNPGEDGSGAIKWHQDWAFLPHTNDSILTVGLAVDDSTKENGKHKLQLRLSPLVTRHFRAMEFGRWKSLEELLQDLRYSRLKQSNRWLSSSKPDNTPFNFRLIV